MEVRFSRFMVGVYPSSARALGCGLLMFGIGVGVVSPGTGSRDGTVFPGIVAAVIGLMLLGLGIGQARSGAAGRGRPEGVHVLGVCVPWPVDRRLRHLPGPPGTLHSRRREHPRRRGHRPRLGERPAAGEADVPAVRARLVGPDEIALPFNLAVGPNRSARPSRPSGEVAERQRVTLRVRLQRQTAVTMTAPTMEPMMPLGRSSRPSPAMRLASRPPTKEPTRPGDEGHRPVDALAPSAQDELGGGADEHAEEDHADDEHGLSIGPVRTRHRVWR